MEVLGEFAEAYNPAHVISTLDQRGQKGVESLDYRVAPPWGVRPVPNNIGALDPLVGIHGHYECVLWMGIVRCLGETV